MRQGREDEYHDFEKTLTLTARVTTMKKHSKRGKYV